MTIVLFLLSFAGFSFAEVQSSVGLSFPFNFFTMTINPAEASDLEIKGKLSMWNGFTADTSFFIGKKDFLLTFYASLAFNFGLSTDKFSISPKGIIEDSKSESNSFGLNFIIGPGFKFDINDSFKFNLGIGIHGYSENTISDSDSSLFFLGGGIDLQFRRKFDASGLQLVFGTRFSLDKLIYLDSDTIDSLLGSSFKYDGIMFSTTPYIGVGARL